MIVRKRNFQNLKFNNAFDYFFRVFIECSAKDQHGLNRIIEEIVWTLIVKGQNPIMPSLMPSSGSVGANLSLSVSIIFFFFFFENWNV